MVMFISTNGRQNGFPMSDRNSVLRYSADGNRKLHNEKVAKKRNGKPAKYYVRVPRVVK